ncbi:MAG: DUF1735 domain-containing protein [Tannerellaceae bacterium]|nr:DUF1735 domain-containing protein [Tannerellaceae bacterium]
MYNKIKQIRTVLFFFAAIITGMTFTSCDEDITIGDVDETPYQLAKEVYGFLKSSSTSRSVITVELRNQSEESIYFGLTKATESAVNISIAVDESLVDAYNKENFSSYGIFPAANVTIENNGTLSVEKRRTQSGQLKITLTKGNLSDGTYLLPVIVKENPGIELVSGSEVVYYLVKVLSTPGTDKPGGIKTLCYIEVNDNNILNVGSYTLEESGIPFFDMVVIFAANINYNEATGEVYLNYNDNVTHLLANKDKYLKPLQDKGIKVILGLLNNHDFVGLGNLSGQSLRNFAMQCKHAVDTYGLDGIDLDDEWSAYNKNSMPAERLPEWKESGEKMSRLMIEFRKLMPDKIITLFEIGVVRTDQIPATVDGYTMTDVIDYSMYPYYTDNENIYTTRIGMPNERFSPVAVNLWDNSPEWGEACMTTENLQIVSRKIREGGYGLMFFYDLRTKNLSEHLSAASQELFGEKVILSGSIYEKDW